MGLEIDEETVNWYRIFFVFQLIRKLENFETNQPHQHTFHYILKLLEYKNSYTNDDFIAAAKS